MRKEVRELREQLLNALLWSGNEGTLVELEKKAISEDIFDDDNGEVTKRKPKESLGMYIDRCNKDLMKNFSRNKYEKLKSLYNEYNNFGDSSIEITESVAKRPFVTKKKIAVGVGVTAAVVGIAGIFKKFKK
ncbi:hypothetical protein [uncultured Clostridium sp.]|uniref:hypothetical protein n=1 Tax=uncultured Clostridium sp. TaxID=59620 RepID=UPI00262F0EC1|nr:hypothetical protein [uncultured Clostridium sp.]